MERRGPEREAALVDRIGGAQSAKRHSGTAFEKVSASKLRNMEKMIWGSIVSILGIISLVAAFWMVNTGDVAKHLSVVVAGGVLGTVAFFAGIWMMPNKSRS